LLTTSTTFRPSPETEQPNNRANEATDTMSTDDKKKDPRSVKLTWVRYSFTDSLKDKKATVEGGVPKHTSNLILVKEPTPGDKLSERAAAQFEANRELIRGALEAAGVEFNGKKDLYLRIMEDDPKRCAYRPGSKFKNKDGDIYKGYEGNFAISASGPGGNKNPRRPKLFDRRKRPVEEKDILDVCYGGTYGDAIVSFYGTDTGGLGIFCTIEALRSYEEGERMGGGVYVDADDFDDMDDADDAFDGAADPLG
jgi:hypothetical protein